MASVLCVHTEYNRTRGRLESCGSHECELSSGSSAANPRTEEASTMSLYPSLEDMKVDQMAQVSQPCLGFSFLGRGKLSESRRVCVGRGRGPRSFLVETHKDELEIERFGKSRGNYNFGFLLQTASHVLPHVICISCQIAICSRFTTHLYTDTHKEVEAM